MAEFKWIWNYLKKFKLLFISALTLVMAMNLLNMVNPYLQGYIVDVVIKGNDTAAPRWLEISMDLIDRVTRGGIAGILLKVLIIMIVTTVVRAVIRYVYQLMFETISQTTIYKVRENTFKRVQELDFEFFDRTKTGDIMARMTGDLEAVRHFSAFVIYSMFLNIITFVTVMIVLFSINALFTAILLCVSPVIGFFTYKLAGEVKPAFSAIREQFSRLNSVVQENISGNRVIKAFAKEDYEIYKFSRENAGFRDRNIDAAKIWEKYLPVLDSMAGALSVTIILVGGIMVINKNITIGELVTFNGFVWALNNPMRMAGWLINDTQRFAASAEKIIALLNRKPRISNSEDRIVMDKPRGNIQFKNVCFKYGDETVLKNISFTANPGQTIAIVGGTGSGKSTLVSLISRFYDCTGGEILIDGVNIKDYDLKVLRENIAVAMQDIFLFSDTIEGNIAYGVPDISLENVEWAAGIAGASDFIKEFNEGYDTIIGERGVGLSGGQKQRIALARALVKDPTILILDDTTSSVDIETEHEIHKTLKDFYQDKTTFIIAHRISSVKNADQILVLDGGRIIERGTHEELLEMKGYYFSVFQNQYGDFDKNLSDLVG